MKKHGISLVLSFMLSFILVLVATAFILWNTLFSCEYHVRRITGSAFASFVLDDIREAYFSLGAASGIPSGVMEGAVTHTQAATAVRQSVAAAFQLGQAFDYDAYSAGLYALFSEYARGAGAKDTAELREGLQDLSDLCAEVFYTHTNPALYRRVAQPLLRYRRYLGIASVCLIMTAICLVIALLAYNKRQAYGYGVYVFGADAMIYLLVPLSVRAAGALDGLNITPYSFKRLFSSVLGGFFDGYYIALIPAAAMLAVCLAGRSSNMRKFGRRGRPMRNEWGGQP
ncbi:MAG: hypothetical protein LBH95_05565 [Oscillospiraceae bacterium]|jgi:hypothetical protein|nr:hypothetical protein [Oscillospiraceae bacterium]